MSDRIEELLRQRIELQRRIMNGEAILADRRTALARVDGQLAFYENQTEVRLHFVDFDARRDPGDAPHCVMCQKRLRPGERTRTVRLVHVGAAPHAMHVEDILRHDRGRLKLPDGAEDRGDVAIGTDCARRLGTDWNR